MFESLERREFLSVTPTSEMAPVTDASSATTVDVDDTAEKKRPKPKPSPTLVPIQIIGVLIC